MLSLPANILIICLAMFGSWAFMAGLNRFWPVPNRYAKNDQVGWQLNVLGTTYAADHPRDVVDRRYRSAIPRMGSR
jgi:hypothetical protein